MHGAGSEAGEAAGVLYRYATAIDTKDWLLLHECFEPSCVFTAGDAELVLDGVDAIVDFMTAAHRDIDGSQHRLSNMRIELAADGRSARSRTYLEALIVHRLHRDGPTFQLWAEYHDRLEVVPGPDGTGTRWQIAERNVTSLWRLGNASILGPTVS
jgi:3-phenylpropionate/cinnamic acid dioxygenase small subunit